ncbi:DUF887-domain-containing protein [Mycena olivaceomarginata]|nr:DUF887-domain-containing protein [Mycena olivaceomarginata]
MDLQKTIDHALPKFRPHLPTFVASFAFFTIIHVVLVPLIGRFVFPAQWTRMGARKRNNWAIHTPTASLAGMNGSGTVQAVAAAYFLWDLLDAVVNFEDLGFVLHGISCFAIYFLSFQPFLAYYASRCLLWEASTFFLNIHWALDKLDLTGGALQLVNGVCLILTFFSVRLVYGGYTSYQFFQTLYERRDEISTTALVLISVGNVLLQGLNWFWLGKMISALRKRFAPAKAVKHQNGAAHNGGNKTKRE